MTASHSAAGKSTMSCNIGATPKPNAVGIDPLYRHSPRTRAVYSTTIATMPPMIIMAAYREPFTVRDVNLRTSLALTTAAIPTIVAASAMLMETHMSKVLSEKGARSAYRGICSSSQGAFKRSATVNSVLAE